MHFHKQTFSDPNENIFYSYLSNFKRFNIYKPNINYTYNCDLINLFGLSYQEEMYGNNILRFDLLF